MPTFRSETFQIWRPAGTDTVRRNYKLHPSLDEAHAFLADVAAHPLLWLTYDIETPNSASMDEDERDEDPSYELTQIQFSLRPGEGIAFPPDPAYLRVARLVMALGNPKAGHNAWLYDDPRLRHNGFEYGGAPPHDTMAMWHHMQPDLPANLQSVASFYGMDAPWKHLAGTDLPYYGCCDVDAPQRILARLPDQLRKRGLWDGYERLVYRVRPILAKMERRGIPINDEKRRAFGAELDIAASETDVEMQKLVPEECRNVHPKQGYKKVPKDTTGLCRRKFRDAYAGVVDATGGTTNRGQVGRTGTVPTGASNNGSAEGMDRVDGLPNLHGMVERWCRIEPFKPSSQQLIRYMRHRNHPVPINLKKGRETSAAKELERLARKTHDPLYRRVIWYREVRLMKATFVDGWAPKADGRVHTTFTFKPATGQLASRDPNVQNAPEHEKEGRTDGLADKFQRIIEAPQGYKIVSFDHKSFHALTLAFLAVDRDYMRVVRLDVHSFLASQFLKLKPAAHLLSMQDDELRDYLRWVKREHRAIRDGKAKRTILGWGFGMGYRTLYNTYMESFSGEAEAKLMIKLLEESFPVTVRWRKAIQLKAHLEPHYLASPWGFLRWFWDVKHYDGRTGLLVNGDQAEQAIAFLPANLAFGMMRQQAVEMDKLGLDERYGLVNNVHDSWKFCCPDPLVEECLHTVKGIMEAKCPVLKDPIVAPDGLWCAVSCSVGQNNAAKSESNPDGREEVTVDGTRERSVCNQVA